MVRLIGATRSLLESRDARHITRGSANPSLTDTVELLHARRDTRGEGRETATTLIGPPHSLHEARGGSLVCEAPRLTDSDPHRERGHRPAPFTSVIASPRRVLEPAV